jgi:hypothetical protein
MFRSRPTTSAMVTSLRKIERALPGPYDPEALGEMMLQGKAKLDLEVQSAKAVTEPYLVEVHEQDDKK